MSRRKRLAAARALRLGSSAQPRKALEILENRRMLAAHIVGNATVFSSIQAAVDASVAGQTITVDAGTYPEEVVVAKQLTIKGPQSGVDARSNTRGAGEAILTGASAGGGLFTASFKIMANDVTIDGFTAQGEDTAATDTGAGIVIMPNVSGTHIINDIIQNNSTGLYLANASATDAALIQHDVFKNNNNGATDTNNGGRGIYTDGSISGGTLQDVTIDGNFFTLNLGTADFDVQAGIGLEGGTSSVQKNINITNNVFDHNGKAVLALNTTGLLIDSNVVGNHYDTDSASLRFEGNDHNVTITHNDLYGNGAHAIRIDSKGTPGNDDTFTITNNNIYDNGLEESGIALQMVSGQYTGTLNATNNYWGSSSGPSGTGFSGSGDGIDNGAVNGVGGVPINVSPVLTTFAVNPEIPYYGLALIPTASINAVDFDHGLDGTSYHDTTVGNTQNQYRPNVDVDIATTTDTTDPLSGYEVTNTASGEWLRYTINTATAGVYTLSARVQSTTAGAKFHYEIDGAAVTSSITIPAASGWQTLTQANISLPSGTHILRLVFDANNTGGERREIWKRFQFQPLTQRSVQRPHRARGSRGRRGFDGHQPFMGRCHRRNRLQDRALPRRLDQLDANRHHRRQRHHLFRHNRRAQHALFLPRSRHQQRRRFGLFQHCQRDLAQLRHSDAHRGRLDVEIFRHRRQPRRNLDVAQLQRHHLVRGPVRAGLRRRRRGHRRSLRPVRQLLHHHLLPPDRQRHQSVAGHRPKSGARARRRRGGLPQRH